VKLGRASRKLLVYLLEHGPSTAAEAGAEVYTIAGRPQRGSASAEFAASMLLGRMRKRGLVELAEHGDGQLWTLTDLARRAMTAPIAELIARSSVGAALQDIRDRGIDAHLADVERRK
jgi:hypothetical protein